MNQENKEHVKDAIRDLFTRAFPNLANADNDVDIFDWGATSLGVVDLQLQVEGALGWSVETHILMQQASVNAWAAAYSRAREIHQPNSTP